MLSHRKYHLAVFYVIWCLYNTLFLLDFIDRITWPELPTVLAFFLHGLGSIFVSFAPYILVTTELHKLGQEAVVIDDVYGTFVKLSPFVLVYFSLIVLIWYPADGDLVAAISYKIQNPNWWQLGVWAIVIY